MKIAISSKGTDLNSEIDGRFGRCPYFIIVDIAGKEFKLIECIKNEAAERSGGAGSYAAKLVAEKKIDAVLTGEVGPNALEILNQFNIKVYKSSGIINEALINLAEPHMLK